MESIVFVGIVHSSLKELSDCPLQETEGAPEAILEINEEYRGATTGLAAGAKVLILTWLHKGNRSTLTTKPRNDANAKTRGVFATRSPDRPNPIGLHEVTVKDISTDGKITVSNLEVLDGTPVMDIKIVF